MFDNGFLGFTATATARPSPAHPDKAQQRRSNSPEIAVRVEPAEKSFAVKKSIQKENDNCSCNPFKSGFDFRTVWSSCALKATLSVKS
jgi:hypothetical protein